MPTAFWKQVADSRFFCHSVCGPCRGDEDEENLDDLDEDFYREVGYQMPVPVAQVVSKWNETEFSLPWSDLTGNQKESLMTTPPISPRRHQTPPPLSLLPISKGSTAHSFNSLCRPIFVTGVPTKANVYTPSPRDNIDAEVHSALMKLHSEAAALLALRRVEPGQYEIEGRRVVVYKGAQGFFVHEDEVGGIADMSLQAYIALAANVALDLQKFAAFPDETLDKLFPGGPTLANIPNDEDRYGAMQIACMLAKLRLVSVEKRCRQIGGG
jgi:hypothetical protein